MSTISWIKNFRYERANRSYKVDNDTDINSLKIKCKILPSIFFYSEVYGIFVVSIIYGTLVGEHNCFLLRLLENYAILSGIMYPLYFLMYFSLAGNTFHYMYGRKKLFKIIFTAFSLIVYVIVAAISMNK